MPIGVLPAWPAPAPSLESAPPPARRPPAWAPPACAARALPSRSCRPPGLGEVRARVRGDGGGCGRCAAVDYELRRRAGRAAARGRRRPRACSLERRRAAGRCWGQRGARLPEQLSLHRRRGVPLEVARHGLAGVRGSQRLPGRKSMGSRVFLRSRVPKCSSAPREVCVYYISWKIQNLS